MNSEVQRFWIYANVALFFFFWWRMISNIRRGLASPRALFFNLWCGRLAVWGAITTVGKYFFRYAPVWLLFVTIMLLFLLWESFKLWKLTGLFSRLDFPLFPRYRLYDGHLVWPTGKVFQRLLSFIQSHHFEQKSVLKLGEGILVAYSPVYLSEDRKMRLQLSFDFLRPQSSKFNCIFVSFEDPIKAIVTHNMHSLFSTFYPEYWDVKQCALSSVEQVLACHKARIARREVVALPDEDMATAINAEQALIESINCENGLFEQRPDYNHISLTFAGRYRLWVDLLWYSLFGSNFY